MKSYFITTSSPSTFKLGQIHLGGLEKQNEAATACTYIEFQRHFAIVTIVV